MALLENGGATPFWGTLAEPPAGETAEKKS
jgi:hypothetical protein